MFANRLIFIRISDPILLARALQDVQQAFVYSDLYTFTPLWLLIVTWSDVVFNPSYPELVCVGHQIAHFDKSNNIALARYSWFWVQSQNASTKASTSFEK
jgi:hypothetical protein